MKERAMPREDERGIREREWNGGIEDEGDETIRGSEVGSPRNTGNGRK